LYFPEQGACNLIATTSSGRVVETPTSFRTEFNCSIGFVPILGPVEHNEPLYEREAARRALFSYQAARNFRNIWYHYPALFDKFRDILRQTWPGMDVEPPTVDLSHSKPRLHMFCPEGRIPREIFWAGFGFQVWCQMLTHLIQSGDSSLFLIDEPDIYLHSDLQRQLLGLLRNLGPDIVIATHSTEIITEAEPDDIVLINKRQKRAKRIQHPAQLTEVFSVLGSNLNPILTQLAKTRRVVFVEGTDFQILSRFATKLGFSQVGNRAEFAVVPAEGFNPERVRNLKDGMEFTLGSKIKAVAIFDRDFRGREESESIITACNKFCDYTCIHERKEIENFLLVSTAIDRAAERKVADRAKRTGKPARYNSCAGEILQCFSAEKKSYVMAQCLAKQRAYARVASPKLDDATITQRALEEFDARWCDRDLQLAMMPGKEALATVNENLQSRYGISVTTTAIIDAMRSDEIPLEMISLIRALAKFSTSPMG
jgi:hypothetical protein